ncbi:MAG: tetratricopeptide repeat protein [Gammaproteobacteria bacterium]
MIRTALWLGLLVVANVGCSVSTDPSVRHPDTQFLEPAVRDALATARARFDRADLTAPDAAYEFAELGKFYLGHHLNDGALDCFAAARRLAPGEPAWHYYAAQASAALGDTASAIDAMQNVHRLVPDDAHAAYWLGRWHLDLAQSSQASSYVTQALAGAGQDAAVLALAGELALLDGRNAAAQSYLEQALQRQPSATRLYYPLARVQRDSSVARQSALLARAGDGQVRLDDPRMRALASYSRSTQMLLEQGGALLTAKRYREAARVFAQATERNPDDVYAWTSLGRALEVTGDIAGARSALNKALTLEPGAATAQLFLGMLNERAENDEAAISAYRAALESDPNNARPQLLLAHALLRSKQPDDARVAYATLVAQRPGNLLARYYLALIHLSQGRCAAAGPVLSEAEALKANYGPVLEVRARYNALCQTDAESLAQAREISDLLSGARPDARSAVTRALVMHALGDLDAAKASVASALALATGTPFAAEIQAHLSSTGQASTAWPPGSVDLAPPRLGPDSLR